MIDFNALVQGLEWEKSVVVGSTRFVPITGKLEKIGEVDVVVDETAGVTISELENEDVNRVYVDIKNRGARLVISGLVIEGGRQTRTVTRPFIVDRPGRHIIAVNCVEQGRWAYGNSTSKFEMRGRMVSRRTKQSYSRRRATQSATWRSISHIMETYDVHDNMAPTQNLVEVEERIMEGRRDEINRIRERILPAFTVEGQRGVVVLEGGQPTSVECFDDPDKWSALRDRFVEANLLDTLANASEEEEKIKESRGEMVAEGVDPLCDEVSFRLSWSDLVGWGVGYEDDAVYITLGKDEERHDSPDPDYVERICNMDFRSHGEAQGFFG